MTAAIRHKRGGGRFPRNGFTPVSGSANQLCYLPACIRIWWDLILRKHQGNNTTESPHSPLEFSPRRGGNRYTSSMQGLARDCTYVLLLNRETNPDPAWKSPSESVCLWVPLRFKNSLPALVIIWAVQTVLPFSAVCGRGEDQLKTTRPQEVLATVLGAATSNQPPQRREFQEPRLVPGDTKFIKTEPKASYSCPRSCPLWIMTSRQVCEGRTLVFDRVLIYSLSMHRTCYILANYRILGHLFFYKEVLPPCDMIISNYLK